MVVVRPFVLLGLVVLGAGCPDDGGLDGGTGDWSVSTGMDDPGAAPELTLSVSPVKRFDFSWAAVVDAEHYQLLESPAAGEPLAQLGGDIVGESVSFEMPLHARFEASYMLRACNGDGCTDSAVVEVMGSLAEAVGYVKASNTGAADNFGTSVALSADGNTLAVGAVLEASSATGIGGNQADDSAPSSGAVYVFVRDGVGTWSQQAYVKASNTGADDYFGTSVALSGDGNTLAVGASGESSSATGIGGNQANDDAEHSGAVYVFARDGAAWSQQAYVKASNAGLGTGVREQFGNGVALSGDGDTLAVGAQGEDSNATGIGGNQADDSAADSGAVYVFVRDAADAWSQQAYVKASNTGEGDQFGASVALSGNGSTLAVGAQFEDGNATGIGGNQADDSVDAAGAVYVFVRDAAGAWSQQAYVKGSITAADDWFGRSVALSGDGDTLAAGTLVRAEASSGAVDVFVRDPAGAWSQQAYVTGSNTDGYDTFGQSLSLSADGNTLAVGADGESNGATGITGHGTGSLGASLSGAAYVFVRAGVGWSQQAYVKASNTDEQDSFGRGVALSADGNTLAVSASSEDGNATGIGGNQGNDGAANSGAVYLY